MQQIFAYLTFLFLFFPAFDCRGAEATPPRGTSLTYADALRLVLATDPRLGLNRAEAETVDGRVEQAGRLPNPAVGAELENFLGTGPYEGLDGLEVKLDIRQSIETAGKRRKRTDLARRERDLVAWEREQIVAGIEAAVRDAFLSALLAQKKLALRSELSQWAEQREAETNRLVETARSNQVEQTRARFVSRQQGFALERARRELDSAKSDLASLWGDPSATNFTTEGEIVLDQPPPEWSALVEALERSAPLARYSAVRKKRKATLELEQARATPNFEVFAGGRYFNEEDGNIGFLAGVEVPWPLFDRNRGNIRAARAQMVAAEREHEVSRRKLLRELNQAYQDLKAAHDEARTLQKEILPLAEKTMADTKVGYERGQFTQLTVLNSRDALFEVREAHLNALERYAAAQARIEALTRPANL